VYQPPVKSLCGQVHTPALICVVWEQGTTPGDHPTYVIVSAFKQCSKVEYIKEVDMHYSQTGSELIRLDTKNCRVMETVVYLVCQVVASFSVLAQPTVTQGVVPLAPVVPSTHHHGST